MRNARVLLLVFAAAGFARSAAADSCSVKGKMEGQSFDLSTCAIAYFPSSESVALWFMEKPLSSDALETFRRSSYADIKGTAMSFAFCPGGGKPAVSPAAVKDVETATSHASSPMLRQQWLFAPGDKSIRFEKLSGDLKPGGRLAGRITGKKTLDQGQVYTWEANFDLTLPTLTAAAGLSCGD